MKNRYWRKKISALLAGTMLVSALAASSFAALEEEYVPSLEETVQDVSDVQGAQEAVDSLFEEAAQPAEAAAEEETVQSDDTAQPAEAGQTDSLPEDQLFDETADDAGMADAGEELSYEAEADELPEADEDGLIEDAFEDLPEELSLEDTEELAEDFPEEIPEEDEAALTDEEEAGEGEEAEENIEELGADPTQAQIDAVLLDHNKYQVKNHLVYFDGDKEPGNEVKNRTYIYLKVEALKSLFGDSKTPDTVDFEYFDKNKKNLSLMNSPNVKEGDGFFTDFLVPGTIYLYDASYLRFRVTYTDNTVIESSYFKIRAKGTCGSDAEWEYDPLSGTLTISGKGRMDDFDKNLSPTYGAYLDIDPEKTSVMNKLVISNGITEIGSFSFFRGTIKQISIPNSVNKIGKYAFSQTTMTTCTLPESLTELEEGAFCLSSITSMKLPSKLKSIGKQTFYMCKDLASVTLPDGVASIGEEAFANTESLVSVKLPQGLKTIDKDAFRESGLKKVTIPNNVTEMKSGAFAQCKSLASVTLSANLKVLENDLFKYCQKLTEIRIPANVTTIKKGAFENCSALKVVLIPSSVTSIDKDAFKNCPAGIIFAVSKGSYADTFAKTNKITVAYTELADLEKEILAKKDINNLSNAAISKIRLCLKKASANEITLEWKKVKGANGYVVYGSKRKGLFTKLSDQTGRSFTHSGLKKNYFYKYIVIAYSGEEYARQVKAVSETVIAATAGGKYRNTSSVTLSKKKASLKTGKRLSLKGTAVSEKSDGKKYKIYRKLMFESSNPLVATVTSKGKIKAIGKGKCYVYVYAQDGTYKRIRVTVK